MALPANWLDVDDNQTNERGVKLIEQFILKETIAKKIIENVNTIRDNGESVHTADFSETYMIYMSKTEERFPITTSNETLFPHMSIEKKTYNSLHTLYEDLKIFSKVLNFYGALTILDKKPHNILTKNFHDRLKKGQKIDQMEVYFYFIVKTATTVVDTEIAKATYKFLQNYKLLKLSFVPTGAGTGNIKIILKTPAVIDNLNEYHLSDYHVSLDADSTSVKDLMPYDIDFLLNSEVTDEVTNFPLPEHWVIEVNACQRSSFFPMYGIFRKKIHNVVETVISPTAHTNITADDYCTGVNLKNSVKGIAELCYANLDSPMQTNVWDTRKSLSIAKGFIQHGLTNMKNLVKVL